jgi:hypothetical protein
MKRLLGLALLAGGCAGLPYPTLSDAQMSGVKLADLERGRATYLERCSNCHVAYSPNAHSAAEWPALVDRMATNAHLSPTDRQDILGYLTAVRSHP